MKKPILLVWFAVLVAMLMAVGVHLVIRQGFLDSMDERNYLWLADRILERRVTTEPPTYDIVEHFLIPWRGVYNGRMYTHFSATWPALLALGRAVGVPWIVNPILAGIAVLLIYALTNALYGNRTTAMAATFLFAASPFLVFQAGTMLSHVSTAVWLLVGLLALVKTSTSGRSSLAVLAGIALGLGFSTRPLDILVMALPAILAFIIHGRHEPRFLIRQLLLLFVGGCIGLIPFWTYNEAVTGDAWFTPLQLYRENVPLFATSLNDWRTNALPLALKQLSNWKDWFLPFWMIPAVYLLLVVRKFDARDLLCFIMIASLIAAYSFFTSYYEICGPRYHFCALPLSCILIGRLITVYTPQRPFYFLLAVSLYYSAIYLQAGQYMFRSMGEKRSLQVRIERMGLQRAIIFIPDGWYTPMWNIDQFDNQPDFSGIIYAYDIPATNHLVRQHFPDAPAYFWEPDGTLRKLD